MTVSIIGAGPGGLYLALLLKKQDRSRTVRVHERNRRDDTFGFGVVFSDATMDNLREADEPSWKSITSRFHHWDDIDIFYRDEVITSTGHGFAGMSRLGLLQILAARAAELGVDIEYESEVSLSSVRESDLVVAADGANSGVRAAHEQWFSPHVDSRPNRFVWLGTACPFPAFTFAFTTNEHGLWRAHAYQYSESSSTFIVETTDATFAASGLDPDDEAATIDYCERLFADRLQGHGLLANRSIWRRFPTVKNEHWSHDNVVLLGDAAHTAHFSVGSGTKLALEDAIALAGAVASDADIPTSLAAYEAERRGPVDSLQRAAQASLEWFEDTERYLDLAPIQFGFSLLTRSLRITHEDLRERDPAYVRRVDDWFAEQVEARTGELIPRVDNVPPPPLFTPLMLRGLRLPNRAVVSAMCQYSAEDGMPNDWHLVHLGTRAIGGAGLVMTEMTDVSRDGRITPGCAGLYRPEHVDGWRRITSFVHEHSPAKIGIQLAHAGRKGSTKLAWEGMDQPLEHEGWELLAPSPIPWAEGSPVPKEMTAADMAEVRDAFAHSARLSVDAGFDMIELHVAHGYLLGTFVSPLTNHRTDDFGGPLENRMRFPLDVFAAVRSACPDDMPISVRISATDWKPGGITADDAVEIAVLLKDAGADIIDVSAGQTVPDQRPVYGRLFQTPFSERIRHEVGIPTMAVGNVSSYTDVNTILAAGRADLCCLARMHLWDPYWTRHAAHELRYPLPWPKPYSVLDGYTPRFQ